MSLSIGKRLHLSSPVYVYVYDNEVVFDSAVAFDGNLTIFKDIHECDVALHSCHEIISLHGLFLCFQYFQLCWSVILVLFSQFMCIRM